jgi:hypothetical protein
MSSTASQVVKNSEFYKRVLQTSVNSKSQTSSFRHSEWPTVVSTVRTTLAYTKFGFVQNRHLSFRMCLGRVALSGADNRNLIGYMIVDAPVSQ